MFSDMRLRFSIFRATFLKFAEVVDITFSRDILICSLSHAKIRFN